MAGIGFVLRKLAAKENLSSLAAGFILSAVVAAGPWLLTTAGLLIVSYSSTGYFTRVRDYLLFRSLVTFAFAFSLLLVSILQLPATRFVADRFFERRFQENRSIYMTAVLLTLGFGMPLSLVLVLMLQLPFAVGLAFFDLLLILMLLWVTTVFVSTLHDYKAVGWAFLLGVATSVVGTLIGAQHRGTAGALLGYLLGEGLIVSLLATRIIVEFPGPVSLNLRFFFFLKKRKSLMGLGFIMAAGIWIDKILFWYGPGGEKVVGYVHVNHLYDIAMFFALLTIIPTLALFVFYFETGFYERYRQFFALLDGRRPLSEVLEAKEQMISFIKQGLGYILKLQGAVTFVAVLNAHGFLSLFHANLLSVPIFRMGALGGFCQVIVTIEMTLLLYFNQQRMVAKLAWALLLANAGFTVFFWLIGPRLEGFGYLVGCLISAIYGYVLLDRGVYDFEFSVFMNPPEEKEEGEILEPVQNLSSSGERELSKQKGLVLGGLLAVGIVLTAPPAMASSLPTNGWHSIKRQCLVLYEGKASENDDKNNFRAYWEFPLNYLGFDAVYQNMKKGFPDPSGLKRFRAVFLEIDQNPMRDSFKFWKFLSGLLDKKIPFVILSDLPERRKGDPHYQEVGLLREHVLLRMGLKIRGVWDTNPFDLSYGIHDPTMEGFEAPLPHSPQVFRPLVSFLDSNRVFLGVKSEAYKNEGVESAEGLIAPWGGMILDPFMIRWPSLGADATRWYVNPFRFLQQILKAEKTPRMDLTTLNGRRIFYSQVDGDAFDTLSRYRRRQMSAEVLYRAVFRPIPLPFTVSVITSQIDPKVQGSPARVYWARRIYSLPNVEAGSHTFSHPFYWNPSKKQVDEGPTHISIPGYHLSMETEIRGSIDYINRHLLPIGKRVKVLQWSGDTRPGKEALNQLTSTGVLNINGSDSRFDNIAPSYTFVFPYFRRVGPYLQYFNSDVNDYILTNDWRGPFFGYLNVVKTFQNTDRPRRTSPIDVYFHFYAGQRESALNALLQVLAWVQGQSIAPLFASQFVLLEKGYIHARIEEKSGKKNVIYQISNYGADTTVRFDHAESLYPDRSRSMGVIGFRHRGKSLYLYLDPGKSTSVVGLVSRPPNGVWLSRATGYVKLLSAPSPRLIEFVYDGWEPNDTVVWRGLDRSTSYRVTDIEKKEGRPVIYRSDPEGRLALHSLLKRTRYRLERL